MKRIISLITALSLLLTLAVFSVSTVSAADDELQFILTNAAGNNNEEITVELQIKNNPGIYAFYFMLYYDTEALILRDCKLSDQLAAEGTLTTSDSNLSADDFEGSVANYLIDQFPVYGVSTEGKSMMILLYENESFMENCNFNGTAVTLTFQIMGIAEPGDYEVGLIPDVDSIINIIPENVPFSMTNSIVRIGSTQVPEDTAPSVNHDETQKVEDTKEDTTNNDIIVLDPDDTTAEDVTLPAETFVDSDGETYYYNEEGETVIYNEEDFTTPAEENTTSPDIDVEQESTPEELDEQQKNNTVLYIVIAAVLVLIAIAGVLVVFIMKTKKASKEDSESDGSNE